MSAIITALGARSPAGLNAEQTALGIRFSHLSPKATKLENSFHEPVGMSLLSALPDDLEGAERMIALAVPALAECLAGDRLVSPRPAANKPVVLLGCPSPRPGFSAEDAARVLRTVVDLAKVDADPTRSAAFAVGHAGFAVALERALSELALAPGASVIAGCVDSYYDARAIAYFDEERRVLSARAPDGFLPSEGAAFVAIRSASAAKGGAPLAHPFGEVVLAATDVERTVLEGKPNLARASTDLLARVEAALSAGQRARSFGWFLRSTNGEQHRAREARFVMTRLAHLLDPGESRLDELSEHMGDAGAATGALLAVFACMGLASGYAPHRTAVLWLSSDGPERGVVVLREAQ